jgi:DNA repair photolyase
MLKGRGTPWDIEHRFARTHHEAADDGWPADAAGAQGATPALGARVATQVIEQTVRTILSGNDSPDIAFDLSINPYRGCEHGCVYCFARPTHSYLDLSPGLDFETKIVAKVNAAERLRAALSSPRYEPLILNIGSATDAYQPAERRLRITRSVIEVLAEFRHAFSIITKSSGIERDVDVLAPLAQQGLVAVYVSIPTIDGPLARIMEPRASAPARRMKTIERLARAGIPVGVSVSPLIPFINDMELERVLEQARGAGARCAFATVLRLPWEVNPLFQQWLQTHFPQRAARVMARMHDLRGGRDNDARFHHRMQGQGVWGQLLAQRFAKAAARWGLATERMPLDLSLFRRPASSPPSPKPSPAAVAAQGSLF